MDSDKVASAINTLRAQGQRPTLRAVHGLVGGSMRDVHALWRAIVGDSVIAEESDEPELSGPAADDPDGAEPDDDHVVDDAPLDHRDGLVDVKHAIALAERAVVEAELALKLKLDALPLAEHDFSDSRARLIEALSAQVGVLEGHRRGLFAGDDQVCADLEGEVQDAAAHYRACRQRWRLAMQAVEGFTARQREAQQRLKGVRREGYLQTACAELWQALQDAIAARASDPRLDTRYGVEPLKERQARWYHEDNIKGLQRQCDDACDAAGL
jgi:hypothetical protein